MLYTQINGIVCDASRSACYFKSTKEKRSENMPGAIHIFQNFNNDDENEYETSAQRN